ncbi:MAG TPA: hypothetical protein VFJ82_12355 [Longimicrobium sp.]|nr:hypothetical protein [Longimicrobium sp.]
MPSRFWIVALVPLFACAPVVTHGPRVEPGAELMMTLGGPRPFCGSNTDTECNAGLIPTWGAGVRYGFTPDGPAGVAALAGLSVPIADPLGTEVDGFVQAPSSGVWAWGGGALWSPRHLMPYAQVGQMPPGGGPGWYLTLGYAHLYRDPSLAVDQEDTDGDVMARPPRYWAPGAAVRTRRGGSSLTFYVQGAFGSYLRRDAYFDPATNRYVDEDVRKPVRTVLFGATWAIGFGDIHFPHPSGPPRTPPPIPNP